MEIIPLSYEEQIQYGATHKCTIDYVDLQGYTSGVAVPIFSVKAGFKVSDGWYDLETGFAGSGTGLALTVGDGGDVDRFSTSKELHTTGTEILWWAEPAVSAPFVYLVDDTIDVIFTQTGGSIASHTQGKIHIYLKIVDTRRLRAVLPQT